MHFARIAARLTVVLLLLAAGSAAAASEKTVFARVDVDEHGRPRALQMAIVRYVPVQPLRPVSVDLISAIHIGDAAYFRALNERFAAYDAVLYELVAPRGMVVTRDTEKRGVVSGAQQLLTRLLDLSFQLDEIDYTGGNFVHADLSAAELSASMAERDESLYAYLWRVFFVAIREYAKDPLGIRDLQTLASAVGPEGDVSLKTLLAYEVANTDSIEAVFGDDADSAIIGARNERAIEVLKESLDAGVSRAGIFYGVGHMPDLEERLLAMGLVRAETAWVDAWLLGGAAAE
jgi:hypothetical protein